ncbi:MAG: hypothetical protein AB1349_13460 [Elusimicrobiota bacterium]
MVKFMTERSQNSLKEIVGSKVYSVWIDMLSKLVPDGRTHRLAPIIASMLRYASEVAYGKYGDALEERSIAYSLQIAQETDYDECINLLLPIVDKLFADARINPKRKSVKGEVYSIAEAAVQEFVSWYNMPWE